MSPGGRRTYDSVFSGRRHEVWRKQAKRERQRCERVVDAHEPYRESARKSAALKSVVAAQRHCGCPALAEGVGYGPNRLIETLVTEKYC